MKSAVAIRAQGSMQMDRVRGRLLEKPIGAHLFLKEKVNKLLHAIYVHVLLIIKCPVFFVN